MIVRGPIYLSVYAMYSLINKEVLWASTDSLMCVRTVETIMYQYSTWYVASRKINARGGPAKIRDADKASIYRNTIYNSLRVDERKQTIKRE